MALVLWGNGRKPQGSHQGSHLEGCRRDPGDGEKWVDFRLHHM